MEKKIIVMASLLMLSLSSFAQLTVNADGSVSMVTNSTTAKDMVKIGSNGVSTSTYVKAALHPSINEFTNSGFNIGTVSESIAYTNDSGNKAVGVLGLGGGAQNGNNYGVLGLILNSYGSQTNGAAIYGATQQSILNNITGSYAGYFDGATYVNGNITAFQHLTPSDLRLKENMSSLYDGRSDGNALKDLLSMSVYKFTYKDQEHSRTSLFETQDKGGVEVSAVKSENKLHFGLVAQELKEIYPNLVEEGQDGYLAVNYVELVPVLIKAIQDLNDEIDALKGGGTVRKARSTSDINSQQTTNTNSLYQNNPNPFKEQTVIRFTLADDAADAAICIFDMTGKQLKRIPVTSGMDDVTINGGELGAGMFLYSLIVNGQEVDTKRMILSK